MIGIRLQDLATIATIGIFLVGVLTWLFGQGVARRGNNRGSRDTGPAATSPPSPPNRRKRRPVRLLVAGNLWVTLGALATVGAVLVGLGSLLFGQGVLNGDDDCGSRTAPASPTQTQLNRSKRRPIRELLVIDGSTSMGCPVDPRILEACPVDGEVPPYKGESRIEAAVQGATQAVPLFRPGDSVGLWTFANGFNPRQEIKRLNADGEPLASELECFREDVERDPREQASGPTHLYDTVSEAVRGLWRGWQSGAINVLVILTDGKNRGGNVQRQRRLNDILFLARPNADKKIYVLFTAAWDSPPCDKLLTKVTVFERSRGCFRVDERNSVDDAFRSVTTCLKWLSRSPEVLQVPRGCPADRT